MIKLTIHPMRKLFFLFLLLEGLVSTAQEIKTNDLDLDFYGFIRNEFYLDTYKSIDAAHDQFYLVPLYVGKDANGEDINEQTSANLSAFTTRLGVKINGPEIFGAKTSGNIEFDFGGIIKSEPTLLRIRHAYSAFSWEKSKLLVGQTWHPFWGGSIFPTIAGLNTGAPFQAFSRSPQVRYDPSPERWFTNFSTHQRLLNLQISQPQLKLKEMEFFLNST